VNVSRWNIRLGSQTSVRIPGWAPVKPAWATPTTWYDWPSSQID
jgi:hypothetical protein